VVRVLKSSEITEQIRLRLESLGYHLKDNDSFLIAFEYLQLNNQVLVQTNLTETPNELFFPMVDLVSFEFLNIRRLNGKLEGFDFEALTKQVKEGDKSITFEPGTTPEERFKKIVHDKRKEFKNLMMLFRKMVW
jgi:hypothetical protein